MKYVFKANDGLCPKCMAFGKIYFIQDRYIGAEKYEYVLMSRPTGRNAKKFVDVNRMVNFLLGENLTDSIAINLILNQMTIYQSSTHRMLEKDGIKYVWDETQKELREYMEPKQESGYCDTYLECLNLAKKILQDEELKSSGTQLSLFD